MKTLNFVVFFLLTGCLETVAVPPGASGTGGGAGGAGGGISAVGGGVGGNGGSAGSGGGGATGTGGGAGGTGGVGGAGGASTACQPGCPAGYACSSGVCVGAASPVLLEVKAYSVQYRVTLNGATPTVSSGCSGASMGMASVTFRERTSGWARTDTIRCGNSSYQSSVVLAEGAYDVTVNPLLPGTGIPGGDAAGGIRGLSGLEVRAALSNVVVPLKTHPVSYRVTLNGATPTTTCSGSISKATVRFVDTVSGWSHTDSIYCSNAGFAFTSTLPEGTYAAWVASGGGLLTNLPMGDAASAVRVLASLAVTSTVTNLGCG